MDALERVLICFFFFLDIKFTVLFMVCPLQLLLCVSFFFSAFRFIAAIHSLSLSFSLFVNSSCVNFRLSLDKR